MTIQYGIVNPMIDIFEIRPRQDERFCLPKRVQSIVRCRGFGVDKRRFLPNW